MSNNIMYHDWRIPNVSTESTMENYVMHGFPPGGFLTAVLADDYGRAFETADSWNSRDLDNIIEAVAYACPEKASGSYEAVKDWCSDKDGRRSKYVTWAYLNGAAPQTVLTLRYDLDSLPGRDMRHGYTVTNESEK